MGTAILLSVILGNQNISYVGHLQCSKSAVWKGDSNYNDCIKMKYLYIPLFKCTFTAVWQTRGQADNICTAGNVEYIIDVL